MKKFFKYILYILVGVFALIGLVFTAVFFAMRFHLFNVRGSITDRNTFFPTTAAAPRGDGTISVVSEQVCANPAKPSCEWNETPEWQAIKGGLTKDQSIINDVGTKTGVDPRMIAAVVVPEQTRFFTSNRDVFKRYFEPLKILGSLTQFSLGISGIKQETAVKIEEYANDPSSVFYPGPGMAELIAYSPDADHDTELYNRLTDAKNHYYQYLYTAIYIKEITGQWKKSGFEVSNNPIVIVTLFNLGFQHSYPKATPRAAGAVITTGGQSYVYGTLGANFYNSDELSTIFPK